LVKTATMSEMDHYWNPGGGGGGSIPPESYYTDYSGWTATGTVSTYGYSSPFPGNWGLGCYMDGIQTPCERVLNSVSNGTAQIDRLLSPTGSGNIQTPGLSITPDPYDNSKVYIDEKDWGVDIHGVMSYKVTVSSFFLGNVGMRQGLGQTPPNKTITDQVIDRIMTDTIAVLESSATCRDAIRALTPKEQHGSNNPNPRMALAVELAGTRPGVDVVNFAKGLYSRGQVRYNTVSEEDTTSSTRGTDNSAVIYIARYFFSPMSRRYLGDIQSDTARIRLGLHELSHATGRYSDWIFALLGYQEFHSEEEIDSIIMKSCGNAINDYLRRRGPIPYR
jgi:hypothetical protein